MDFTQELQLVLNYSKEEAARLGNREVTGDHLFLGLLRHERNAAVETLQEMGCNLANIKAELESIICSDEMIAYSESSSISISKEIEIIFSNIARELMELRVSNPNMIFLLLVLVRDSGNMVVPILRRVGVTYDSLKEYYLNRHNGGKVAQAVSADKVDDGKKNEISKQAITEPQKQTKSVKTPTLDKYGNDLTLSAENGKLDPVVCRENEIERLIQILGRRKKNNPVLIGEPGVGKSAIVEGLAIRIAERKVPKLLLDKRIVTLDMGTIVAGTKFRGQFEERIRMIIDELKESDNTIIFIDEIHTLVGAGAQAGSLDAANLLKPALARGEIQCIGATTLDEYREVIEKDGALERRFQKILVEQTSYDQTLQILYSIKEKYEKHHNVKYTDEAINACVSLSQRYITDRCQPDKAIDAMDEAGARIRMKKVNTKLVGESVSALEDIRKKKNEAVINGDFKAAAELRLLEKTQLSNESVLEDSLESSSEEVPSITADDVANVVSMITNIPVHKIVETEGAKLLSMSENLKKKIIGQDDAVDKVVKAIQRNRAGLRDPNKPIGTFIFLGPTGVGKTQLAKKLAEYMFDSVDNIIRIDMSEYMERYSLSSLIGAPPGYVGYNEGGQLSEKVRRKPYSVVLLDEIEKAHPDIFNILLQVLDEGRLTDSAGRKIDFKNTILIMTSNIGSRRLKESGNGIGYQTNVDESASRSKSIIGKELQRYFSPEFLNRIDDQILFNQLTKEDIEKILDIELEELKSRMKSMGLSIKIKPTTKKLICEEGFDPQFGARPLKRAIQKYIEDPLAEMIIAGQKPKSI